MPQYFCSLPNPGGSGHPKILHSADEALIERWVKAEDRPGFGVYYLPNPLKPGATAHGKENTAAINFIYVDIDFKDLTESADETRQRITDLLLRPTILVDSGHGCHLLWQLKEAIACDDPEFEAACALQAALVDYLCGDPQVRPWSLLRRPGTLNSKGDPHVLCEVTGRGPVVDISELKEMVELVEGSTLLTRKPKATNGHDGADGVAGERTGPVDVEFELSTMHDGASTNVAHCRVIPALLWRAINPNEVVEQVVDATMAMAERHGLGWTREAEVAAVKSRVNSMLRNLFLENYDYTTGVIPTWLCADFHERWIEELANGRRPDIGLNRVFYVRSYGPKTEANNSAGAEPKSQKPSSGRRVLELRPFTPFDVAKLPPRSWLYGKHYQRRTISLTAGPGGMGKSSLDMVEAIAMATCRNLLGEQPEERLRVWYHNGEDPRDEIDRRLAAICQYYRIPQEELQGWLWTTSGTEFPLRVAKGYANLEIDAALVRQISAAISNNRVDVADFDPFVTLHSVSEVDSGKMDAVVRLFAGIADENDAAIEISHHVRKPAAGVAADYDVHDIRGVAAITDAVRAARVLNRMNEKDAEAAGCEEIERLSRFRVDRAKGNYSPAQAATWRQFVSVDLINGDEVGVVAPWNFPGQGEQTPERAAADQKAEHVFLQLLDKFAARGTNVSANTGNTYAPAKFAEEREAKTAKVSKAALKAAMNRLLDAGRVRSEPSRNDGRSHRLVAWHGVPQ
jgi:RecA-family ATPase